MGVLDEYKSQIFGYFSDWIKVSDNSSNWTIEDFPYATGVDEDITKPHCLKCVTVNNCWFKNEKNKKPEHFNYDKYTFSEIGKSIRGLYHPHCHCKELGLNVPKLKDIVIMNYANKMKNLFDSPRKYKWFRVMGYKDSDKDLFIQRLLASTKDSYRYGNYEKEKHTNAGYQINIYVEIDGINEKLGHTYIIKTCYIVFPNGRIRPVTMLGGWRE